MPGMTEQAYLTLLEEQWQPGTRLDTGLCKCAAEKGWLAALQWLRCKGAPWDTWTCSAAADGQHTAVLLWALKQGCPWGSETLDIGTAAWFGRQALLKWARQRGMSTNMEKTARSTNVALQKPPL